MKFVAVVVILGLLLGIMVWDGKNQVKLIEKCRRERIIPLTPSHFTWQGINELATKGEYQPKCL